MEDDVIGKTCDVCRGPLLMGDATVEWDGKIAHLVPCYKEYEETVHTAANDMGRAKPIDTPPDPAYDPIPETCEEAVALWDAGLPVFTVEMGGLGPSYEQAVHIVAFELVRFLLPLAIPPVDAPESEMLAFSEALEQRVRLVPREWTGGLSKAQISAAINVACVTKRNGWRKAVRMAPVEDRIQVQKFFPVGGR